MPVLAELRLAALRPDLERLGRWDPPTHRARFVQEFRVEESVTVLGDDERPIGSFALHRDGQADDAGTWLRHFHLAPHATGRGIGSRVLEQIGEATDGRALSLVVLQGSRAARFFHRHGFVELVRGDVDAVLHRPAREA
ncbi:GNAT family N-acetyltransferase [Frigoribacterium salinisoli]